MSTNSTLAAPAISAVIPGTSVSNNNKNLRIIEQPAKLAQQLRGLSPADVINYRGINPREFGVAIDQGDPVPVYIGPANIGLPTSVSAMVRGSRDSSMFLGSILENKHPALRQFKPKNLGMTTSGAATDEMTAEELEALNGGVAGVLYVVATAYTNTLKLLTDVKTGRSGNESARMNNLSSGSPRTLVKLNSFQPKGVTLASAEKAIHKRLAPWRIFSSDRTEKFRLPYFVKHDLLQIHSMPQFCRWLWAMDQPETLANYDYLHQFVIEGNTFAEVQHREIDIAMSATH